MPRKPTRRTFLKLSSAAASAGATRLAHTLPAAGRIAIVADSASPLIQSASVQWALGKLSDALAAHATMDSKTPPGLTLVIAPVTSPLAKSFGPLSSLTSPDATALIPGSGKLLATGSDTRGIIYAMLELADRIRTADDPAAALRLAAPIIETTPNKVRSCARSFVSEAEDKPWFYDRAFWTRYLDTLAAARFNRFNLFFGFGYDFPRGVTGDYLHFPYPYLVELPNYPGVHVEPALQPGERQRNLEALQFIAAETARRGLEFQLGIWTHAYQWTDSPRSDHQIAGLTPETHAAYCRDALATLLRLCPQISGLTLRIHGESGIPEGSYPFWQTLFEAISGAGRTIEIDMHAKGLNQEMIDIAHATGMPVKAGAKFWAEHQGIAYHQADIRAAEYPREGVTGTFAVSNGARNFTRYGYGDFYQYPQGAAPGKSSAASQGVDVLYRVWPGTQRHLLWGDPALAAGYGRAANFCGAAGMEFCEPLTFKGREGSGQPGGRNAYAFAYAGSALAASVFDTEKFNLTYLVLGRNLYNPDSAPDFYHRYLQQAFGPAGPGLQVALANSSRILPLITTVWLPSASNHGFWPEMLAPISILPYPARTTNTESPAPHNVSAISPLDPQLFTTIGQHAENLMSGKIDARYNSSEVIAWLEAMVATSNNALETARAAAGSKAQTAEFRRIEEDIRILNGLGSYYANTFRAALNFSLGNGPETLAALGSARDAWASMATRAQQVYTSDISYGAPAFRRGTWADRLPAIDADLAAVRKYFDSQPARPAQSSARPTPTPRPAIAATHAVPQAFHPGSALDLAIATPRTVASAILWYRHVNHGERWLSTPMTRTAAGHTAAIPAAYTASPYPLQYYFELRTATAATLHPAFNPTLSNQPYFAIHKRA